MCFTPLDVDGAYSSAFDGIPEPASKAEDPEEQPAVKEEIPEETVTKD